MCKEDMQGVVGVKCDELRIFWPFSRLSILYAFTYFVERKKHNKMGPSPTFFRSLNMFKTENIFVT